MAPWPGGSPRSRGMRQKERIFRRHPGAGVGVTTPGGREGEEQDRAVDKSCPQQRKSGQVTRGSRGKARSACRQAMAATQSE